MNKKPTPKPEKQDTSDKYEWKEGDIIITPPDKKPDIKKEDDDGQG